MLAEETETQSAEAQAQLGRRLNDIADRYSGSLKRSRNENDLRSELRRQVEEMGYSAEAFQPAVAIARTKKKSDADWYLTSLQHFVSELLGRQAELFPDDFKRLQEREEKKAAKAAGKPRDAAELDAQTDANVRSDPNAGGAKPHIVVDNSAAEQAEGEQVLAAMSPESQSAQAARKRKLAKVE